MDALRNSKKISLLAVAILFLFTFFTLILDAPRKTGKNLSQTTVNSFEGILAINYFKLGTVPDSYRYHKNLFEVYDDPYVLRTLGYSDNDVL